MPAPTQFTVNFDLKDYSGRQAKLLNLLPKALDAETAIRDRLFAVPEKGATRAGIPYPLSHGEDQGDCFCFPAETAAQAHRFAASVHEQCTELNRERDLEHAFLFRFGIARSEVKLHPGSPRFDATHATLAARLRAIAAPGGTLICPHTWGALPAPLQAEYASRQTEVADEKKPSVTYRGHVWRYGRAPEPKKKSAKAGVAKIRRRPPPAPRQPPLLAPCFVTGNGSCASALAWSWAISVPPRTRADRAAGSNCPASTPSWIRPVRWSRRNSNVDPNGRRPQSTPNG